MESRSQALDTLKRLDGATLANAIETFGVRLRNEGFADASIRAVFGDLPPAIGYAATARIRCSSPSPTGRPYHDRTDWWSYILTVPAPRFVVVQDVDDRPGFGAFVGDVHANILRALGCVGYATNGSVRDPRQVYALQFSLFAAHVAISHAFAHIVDFGHPIEIGGLPVASGDLLFGDVHGVQSIPLEIVDQLPHVAADMTARERQVIELCQSRDFSIETLRELVRSLG